MVDRLGRQLLADQPDGSTSTEPLQPANPEEGGFPGEEAKGSMDDGVRLRKHSSNIEDGGSPGDEGKAGVDKTERLPGKTLYETCLAMFSRMFGFPAYPTHVDNAASVTGICSGTSVSSGQANIVSKLKSLEGNPSLEL